MFDKVFESLRGKEVEFLMDGNVIRKGKVDEVEIKFFQVKIDILEEDGKERKIELPMPFDCRVSKEEIILDYQIETIKSLTKLDLADRLASQAEPRNPLYDTTLTIRLLAKV